VSSVLLPVRHLARLLLLAAALAALLPAGQALAGKPGTTPAPAVTLALSSTSGPAGTATAATGKGFPKRTTVVVTAAAASWTTRTDGSGAFSQTVTVPPATATGPLAVTATASTVTATAWFEVVDPAPAPAPQPESRLEFGVSTPSGFHGAAELDAVTALAGEAPTMVLAFSDFTKELDVAGLQAVRARGALPVLTWEPWRAGYGVSQPAYSLDRIAAGDHDAYLTRWGQGLATYGAPVQLRFAHEMNGNWYPWSEGVNGNATGDYVAAWRHVHGVVTAAGATNVQWVWAPNVPYSGSTPLPGLYPGDAYVDVVALDGYNFGTSQTWSTWLSPEALFGPGLQQLRTIAPGKEVLVAETGSSELGGDKAAWIGELVRYLDAQPDVSAFVWFHFDKETDWRINSSPASADAFRAALTARA
jgi:hypothetical protein